MSDWEKPGDWLKLYREIIDSRVFNCGDDFIFKLWIWCLAKANWKRGWAQDREIEPGQFVTGRSSAANEIGVSGSTWYRGMQKLVEFGNIKIENVNNRFSLVSIVNWRVYQSLQQSTRTTDEQPPDNQRTAGEQSVNTIEEGKKERKEEGKNKNGFHQNEFDVFWKSYPRKVGRIAALRAWKKAVKTTDASLIIDACKAFGASPKGTGRFCPHPSTWLNEGRWEDDPADWQQQNEGKTFGQKKSDNLKSAGKEFKERARNKDPSQQRRLTDAS